MPRTDGCLACKQRKKKCDKRKPQCIACARNYLICVWHGTAPLDGRKRGSSEAIIATATPVPTFQGLVLNGPSWVPHILRRESSRQLLEYFCSHTAPVLSTKGNRNNPFTSTLLPVALTSGNDTLLHALLTLAGVHQLHWGQEALATHTWEHHALALRSLKYGITSVAMGRRDTVMLLLVSCLVLCVTEVVRGGKEGSAFYHLGGVRTLIGMLDLEDLMDKSPSVMALALELFIYLLAIAATSAPQISEARQLLLDYEKLSVMVGRKGISLPGACLTGSECPPFALIPQAVVDSRVGLAELQHNDTFEPVDQTEIAGTILPKKSTIRDASDQAKCAYIYEIALRVHLPPTRSVALTRMDHSVPLHEDDTVLLEDAIRILSVLSPTSSIASGLCWPLAVLGSVARDDRHRRAIRSYILELYNTCRFGNLLQTVNVLDQLWSDPSLPISGPCAIAEAMRVSQARILLA